MGRRELRSSLPSSSTPPSKKSKKSPPEFSFEHNPFYEVFGQDLKRASIGTVGCVHAKIRTVIACEENVANGNEVDCIFDDMVQFMELSNEMIADHEVTPIGHKSKQRLFEDTVQRLLTHIRKIQRSSIKISNQQRNRSITSSTLNVIVSAENIALVLYPWSIKGILYMLYKQGSFSSLLPVVSHASKSLELLYWKTLDECLRLLLSRPIKDGDSEGTALKIRNRNSCLKMLTLSMMHKLVPVALRCSLQEISVSKADMNNDTQSSVALQETAKSCFCRLVNNLYRPPLDTICDILLPTLTRDCGKRNHSQKTKIWIDVAISTLRLMNLRLENANPKTSFRLLIQPKVFLDLATIHYYVSPFKHSIDADILSHEKNLKTFHSLFRDLIRYGFFSLEHHMDGFRSLQLVIPAFYEILKLQQSDNDKIASLTSSTTKSSFRGYQEGFFHVMEGFLDYEANEFSSRDATIICCVLPLFLDIFLEQVSKMQKLNVISKSNKKSKVNDKLSYLQFQFFSCLSSHILKGLMASKSSVGRRKVHDSELRLSFFAVLGENLGLLLRYNVYQPSLGKNIERMFLDKLGKEIFELIKTPGRKISFAEWKKCLMILDVLTQLNHTILHGQLAEILAVCLTFDSLDKSNFATSEICEEARAFMVTLITTYGKLRQLNFFYFCIFDALKILSRQKDHIRIIQYLAFVNDRGISSHLGSVIQGSPIKQIQQIFYNINNSIESRSYIEGDQSSREVSSEINNIVTKLLVGLLQNIRVDSNSFNDIYPICSDILSVSVISLMQPDGESADATQQKVESMNNSMIVCAWTIHLKNRCEFWIDKKETESSGRKNYGIPSVVRHALKKAVSCDGVDILASDEYHPDLLETLIFLACQRIQQLHGECYDKHCFAYAMDGEEYNTTSQTLEAKQLVGFILQHCDLNASNTRPLSKTIDRLAILAESIAIWIPHANQNNIDLFLSQLLHAVANGDESSKRSGNLLSSFLNDSSFYEISKVSERLGVNVASFCVKHVQSILIRRDNFSDITYPTLLEVQKSLSIARVTNIHKNRILLNCNSEDLSEINRILRGILQVLEIINKVGVSLWNMCKDALNVFESLMRVESICNIMYSSERSFLDIKVRLISALRTAASEVLAMIPCNSNKSTFETQKMEYIMLLQHALENSFQLIDSDSSLNSIHRCINSCTMIVESLVNQCVALGTESTICLIKVLDLTFDQTEVARGGFQYLLLTNYAVILLRKFGRIFSVNANNAAIKELSRVLHKRIWKMSFGYCFKDKKTQFLVQSQSGIFIAEMLRLSSTFSMMHLIQSSVGNEVVVGLTHFLTSDFEESEARSISYLVGCLAMSETSRTVKKELTNELLFAALKYCDVFLTPLCILVKRMERNEFDEFLINLTSNIIEDRATVIKLKIVHMIVLSAMNQSQIDVLSKHSTKIMNNCLQVMAQVARQLDYDSDAILEVSSLIVDMASRKGMMLLREREIALILARVTSTISVSEQPVEREIIIIQLKAYDATFSLVSLFLQRFSKQVHNCVPSLVITLAAMLQFSLSDSLPKICMSHCGQKFSRLCELLLPHADVYKKHVICLILQFVKSLRTGVDPACKKGLLPGVYCLLDIVQEHESKQLNSMLDEECRAFLRTVHEGYKKMHVYKGQ